MFLHLAVCSRATRSRRPPPESRGRTRKMKFRAANVMATFRATKGNIFEPCTPTPSWPKKGCNRTWQHWVTGFTLGGLITEREKGKGRNKRKKAALPEGLEEG